MKKYLLTLVVVCFFGTPSISQNISREDSLQIMSTVAIVFNVFKQPDLNAFEKISTKELYCIICFKEPDFRKNPYVLKRKQFFNKHLVAISQSDEFIRATKAKEVKLISENDKRADVIALFTIYQKNEIALGHEGAQFGIYFKKIGNTYRFSGMETIP